MKYIHPLRPFMRSFLVFAALWILIPPAGAQLLSDTFESGLGAWTATGSWGTTVSTAHSPTRSATDSPGAYYANNADSALTLGAPLNLSAAVHPVLGFFHRYAIEPGYDVATVEITTNGGASWTPLVTYSGTQGGWEHEQLDLSAFAGEAAVKLRFRLVTDSSVVMDGWYVDDVLVDEMPDAPELTNVVALGVGSVELAWTPSASSGISAYRIYRSSTAGFDWRDAAFVGETDASTSSFVDIAAAPKKTFYYRVMAVAANALYAESNEVSVSLPAGMDYPFLDTAEAGGTYWIADGGWALSTEQAHTGVNGWSDSPGALYANSVNASLRLAAPVDLSAASEPVLTFWQKHHILAGDVGTVEVSINGGVDWSVLKSFTGTTSTNAWTPERIALDSIAGNASVLIRFRLTSNSSGQGDGWWLDDISVGEAPSAIPTLLIDQVTSHGLRLSWPTNSDTLFSHYAIHRVQAASGATYQSPQIASVSDQAQTQWTDSGLGLNTEYAYRVFAVSPYGTYSGNGEEAVGRTDNNPVPFADGFESGPSAWTLAGSWAITTEDSASGSASLADSPLGSYSNGLSVANNYAMTAVDLTGAAWPVLTFKDRHAFYDVATGDRGVLDVSINGTSWTRVYGVTGVRSDWAEQQIDLSRWRGQSNLRIRFYVESNGSLAGDGWLIDDVSVAEHIPDGTQALPFAERFEGGLTNWINGGWVASANAPYEGAGCARDLPSRWTPANTEAWLTLGRELDLSGTTSPQVTLWARGIRGYEDRGRIYLRLSKDGGLTWLELSGILAFNTSWSRFQYAVPADYRVAGVRLEIRSIATSYELEKELYVDKLAVEEAPPAVVLASPVPHLKSVDLSWSAFPDGSGFQRYEIYRKESANVGLADVLVASLADRTGITFTDTGLSIGKTYYYKVYVYNTNDTATASNESQSTTVPIPLADAGSLNDPNLWDVVGAWGVESNEAGVVFSDSPGVQYSNSLGSANNYALTAVDLTGASWPVLTFKDRHAFYDVAAGDRGVLDVSINGTAWTRVYGVTGVRGDWAEQQIDLSRWRGQSNLRIRFYVESNGSLAGDGWLIDDVSVAEHVPAGTQALPFAERFEGGLTNWINGGWVASTNAPYEGAGCARDLPSRWTPANTEAWLTLARELDLSGTTSPQVTLWARGIRGYEDRGRIYLRLSKDGGLTWLELSGILAFNTSWSRFQYAVPADYRVAGVRLEIRSIATSYELEKELYVDKLAVEEAPPAVVLASPVPHLKSVDLSWSAFPDGSGFQRYEIYRKESANVGLGDVLVASLADRTGTTFTDTGLSIGKTYHYKVYVYNTNDTATASNESQSTTVPIPLADAGSLNDPNLWDVVGAWGVESNEAGVVFSDSPGVQYSNSLGSANNYALTAVDLTGVAWPVLTFKDRHAFYDVAAGDRGVLDVSINGTSWTRVYGVTGVRGDWAEQQIDLSRWRGQSNLRIRFYVESNGSLVGDGWLIDDVSVAEHIPDGTQALPFAERFEGGLANWINGGWVASTNAPYEGAGCARDLPSRWTPANTEAWLTLARELDLSGTTSPQVTLWARGIRGYEDRGRIYLRLSKDGGLTWLELSGILAFNTSWSRFQYAVPADYRVAGVRLEIRSIATSYELEKELYVDKLAVEEAPPAVVLASPSEVTVAGMRLDWSAYSGDEFQFYKVYRHTAQNVTESHELIATITNAAQTTFTDSNLSARTRYFYKVFVSDDSDTSTPSNESSAQTLGVPLGWIDGFESTPGPEWTFTGTWGIQDGALTDSPGDYLNSSDTWAQTAVDLSDAVWPVLIFKDRCALPPTGDNAYVQIGAADNNNIASIAWTTVYSVREIRDEWAEQQIDLSRWKGRHTVYVRFRLGTNGSVTDDGWAIDDVELREHVPAESTTGLYERFENGLSGWLNGGWGISTNSPHEGGACVQNHEAQYVQANTDSWLVHGRELDLSSTVSPKVTLWARGFRGYENRGRLYVRLSKDGGVNWLDLTGILAVTETWARFQYDVPVDYRTNGVRVAILSYAAGYDLDSTFYVDAVGVGSEMPEAPLLISPADGDTVSAVRPVLTVANAVDLQSDPLTYSFEVYSDAGLGAGSLVAQNPGIASGASNTSWQVDTELADGEQYWWRCRAMDALANESDWSETGTFFVIVSNMPPTVPFIVSPYSDASLPDASGYFIWLASIDSDGGDLVADYQLQISPDATFANLLVDTSVAPQPNVVLARLDSLFGHESVQLNARYYWRVRAVDGGGAVSGWSTEPFVFGALVVEPPEPVGVLVSDMVVENGQISLSWGVQERPVRIEFKADLTDPEWIPVSGATGLETTEHTFAVDPAHAAGFYRIITE